MRTAFDLTPYRRSTVGFDRLFDALENSFRAEMQDSYRINIAVAGFRPDEIDITAQQNQLVISGQKTEKDEEGVEYVHRGIAARAFERRFQLADYVEVRDANYENGMLTISLQRSVPESLKPRKIAIGSHEHVNDDTPQLTEDKAA